MPTHTTHFHSHLPVPGTYRCSHCGVYLACFISLYLCRHLFDGSVDSHKVDVCAMIGM